MRIFFVILLSLFTFGSLAQYQETIPESYGFKIKIGQTVPDFDLELTNGKKIPIKELRGKVVMLQFTASWCGVCRKEMPYIEKEIWQKHNNNSDFALYGIDLGETRDKIEAFQESTGISYPLTLDLKSEIFQLFTVEKAGVTRNIIINKEGKIVYVTRLLEREEFNKMNEVIDDLLKE